MQQVHTRSETICIYAAEPHSHSPSCHSPPRCASTFLQASMLFGLTRRNKKITCSWRCRKTRPALEEATSQVVLTLPPPKVPKHFSTSMNENSAPRRVAHGATPFQAAVNLLRAVPHTSCMKKGTQGTPTSQHHGPHRPVNHAGLLVRCRR